MTGHPCDVQYSNMIMSHKKVSYVVYSYPRYKASWHRYWCVPETTLRRYGEALEWRGSYVGSVSVGVFHAKSNHIYFHPWCSRGFTVSGQTKGKSGCHVCMDGTASVYLPSSRKLVFMRHRWFLERKHKYHKKKRHFDNMV
jgi:hypothetical protein